MKKVLLITYYRTPSYGPGVQITPYFDKYLRDFIWKPPTKDLLLIGISNKLEILPIKFFNYLASKNPSYSIFPKSGDVEKIMKHCKSGWSADIGDKLTLKSDLRHCILFCRNNTLSNVYGDLKEVIGQWSSKKRTGKLAVLLEDAVVSHYGSLTKEGQI
ncbi:hypothetical protein [Membranihabitans marinus]|uniref:hypothetical protein n=1 Tax=Membranihabitans marinus TaxID=1227546 RepID=UPI001F22E23E|nr:hypothetical protein [Membranihabitans marinus]